MKVKEFDDFKYPNHKPWLVILLLVLLVIFGVQRCRRPVVRQDKTLEEAQQQKLESGAVKAEKSGSNPPRSIDSVKPSDVRDRFERGLALEKAGNLIGARQLYLGVVEALSEGKFRDQVEERLGRVNIELTMTPRPMPEKVEYIVKSGDLLQNIARRFGTTVQLIQVGNNISNPDLIRVGDRIQILKGDFFIEVSKSSNELLLKLNDRFFKRYSVGTGKFGRTPEGSFEITEKIPEPPWYHPDGRLINYGEDENILGTRWMTLRATGDTPDARGYGIHGTWKPESIGKAESAGCVRMKNSEVEELFILAPRGTPVHIIE